MLPNIVVDLHNIFFASFINDKLTNKIFSKILKKKYSIFNYFLYPKKISISQIKFPLIKQLIFILIISDKEAKFAFTNKE